MPNKQNLIEALANAEKEHAYFEAMREGKIPLAVRFANTENVGQELMRAHILRDRLRAELEQLELKAQPADNVVHDRRFAWWEHQQERTAQRQEDASKMHRYHTIQARARQMQEAWLRKDAQEKEEAREQARREAEAAELARRPNFAELAAQEYDGNKEQRARAEQAHKDYAAEERARAQAINARR